jgi:hypothetical protein
MHTYASAQPCHLLTDAACTNNAYCLALQQHWLVGGTVEIVKPLVTVYLMQPSGKMEKVGKNIFCHCSGVTVSP